MGAHHTIKLWNGVQLELDLVSSASERLGKPLTIISVHKEPEKAALIYPEVQQYMHLRGGHPRE